MEFTLTVRNYRGLRNVEWSPSGVCAIVGPNGSGKTTLVDVLQLLQDARAYGFMRAIEAHGGAYGMRHFAAQGREPVVFGLRVGSANWTLQPEVSFSPGGAFLPVQEKLSEGVQVLGTLLPIFPGLPGGVPLLGGGSNVPPDSARLIELISSYRFYQRYALQSLRHQGAALGGDLRLANDGSNLFTVLLNWRTRRDCLHRWMFVTDTLRACYPHVFVDFSLPIAANIVSCVVHDSDNHEFTPALLPDGFLVALLHLCAVASTDRGWVISIDEPENALHPLVIRRLMDAFREWSDTHDVTILLATHSPVILDTFKECPDKVFVLEPGHEQLPVALNQLKKRSWLEHFSLGDLYEHLEYGAPPGANQG